METSESEFKPSRFVLVAFYITWLLGEVSVICEGSRIGVLQLCILLFPLVGIVVQLIGWFMVLWLLFWS